MGSKSGYLYGLDATTGNQLWAREIGEYIVRSTPAIDGKAVFINNGYSVLALSIEDGTTLWTAIGFVHRIDQPDGCRRSGLCGKSERHDLRVRCSDRHRQLAITRGRADFRIANGG